jgi:hypothetical protein
MTLREFSKIAVSAHSDYVLQAKRRAKDTVLQAKRRAKDTASLKKAKRGVPAASLGLYGAALGALTGRGKSRLMRGLVGGLGGAGLGALLGHAQRRGIQKARDIVKKHKLDKE